MSETAKKKRSIAQLILVIFAFLVYFVLLLRRLLKGKNIAVLNPKGTIALQQRNLIFYTVAILLVVAVPTFTALYFIAWRYRESNNQAKRADRTRHRKTLAVCIWLIPFTTMVVLAVHMASATHKLAPHNAIASGGKPLTIQVISLRWKWLFLYPEQGIATVNFVQIPVNTPVEFDLTADETPMSSFWIPNLGGQLYSMTSHENRLNLMADTPGDYPGRNTEINGEGFAGMKFTARASSMDDFNNWAQSVKQSSQVLDAAAYQKILIPSQDNPNVFFSNYETNLYSKVIDKYEGPTTGTGSGT